MEQICIHLFAEIWIKMHDMKKNVYVNGDLVKYDYLGDTQTVNVYGYNPIYNMYFVTNPNIRDRSGFLEKEYNKLKKIPLTFDVLKKNGWEIDGDVAWKEYPQVKLTIMKGVASAINESCAIRLRSVKYVHDLQHLLFGLGISNKLNI